MSSPVLGGTKKKPKFTEERIVRILQEAQSGHATQAEVCRKHGVSQNTFYLWKRKYSGMEQRDVRHVRDLVPEYCQLKHMLDERDLSQALARCQRYVWTLGFRCWEDSRSRLMGII